MNVKNWLKKLNLEQYAVAFVINDVDTETLASLTSGDLKEIGVKSVGHRRKLLDAISRLRQHDEKTTFARNARAAVISPDTYTPKYLAAQILQSKSAIEGERKQVTVLFADIKGSLELIEDSDPEQAHTLLDLAIGAMMEAVHRYEGTVNKVLGDGIMALFGAPLAQEDHAVRACYAALAMQETIQRNVEEVRRKYGVEFQIRVGLNSGEVVVRAIGNDLTMDYDAIGQTTHLAGRMEQLAIPGTVRLTRDTLRLVEGFVEVRSLGPVPVRGLEAPVEVFELTSATSTRTRFQAAVARGLTRFVGRDTELQALNRTRSRADEGQGQIVAVVGEPGVGKSRLFYEFVHSDWTKGCLILESGSVTYGNTTAYLPVIDLLKSYFHIESRDDVRRIREKITGKLLSLDESLKPMLNPLLALLEVPVKDLTWEALDPQQRRLRTLDAIKSLLLSESRVQSLILVFEDLHWIDSETQAFLDSLAESLPTARLLLLVNYRPEYQHTWGSKTYYTQRRIDTLPPASVEELLATLLGENASLGSLKRMMIARTEGNPLFLEESIHALVETGALMGSPGAYHVTKGAEPVKVPATVQGVLAARIDRLAVEDKELLQTCAVIGKDLPYALLQVIADLPEEDLRRGLANLQTAEFLYETRLFPDLEYTFKHALTHDVAYGTLLKERRQASHQRIAEAIKSIYADRLVEQFERLAHHYTEAQLPEQAIDYWKQAGQKASERSASPEAITLLTNGLELIKTLPETPERATKELSLHIALGPALSSAKGTGSQEVGQSYFRARELCREVGEPSQVFNVTWGLWHHHHNSGQIETARGLADEILELAERQSDSRFLLQAHHAAWTTNFTSSELLICHDHAKKGVALYDFNVHRNHAFLYGGHDPGVCAHGNAGMVLWLLGYADKAIGHARAGVTLAEKLGHPYSLIHALFNSAIIFRSLQDVTAVQMCAKKMIDLCIEQGIAPGYLEMGTVLRGWTLVAAGQIEEGIAKIQQAVKNLPATGDKPRFVYLLVLLAEACERAGQPERGLRATEEALRMVEATGVRWWEAEIHRVKGELLLSHSLKNKAESEVCFNQAIKVARSQEAKSLELRTATSLARLWQDQGKHAEVRELLEPIYDWFTEGFDTPDLIEAEQLLKALK
ncbi:MAG: AAA family ATPase [Planctomycetales bacterium]